MLEWGLDVCICQKSCFCSVFRLNFSPQQWMWFTTKLTKCGLEKNKNTNEFTQPKNPFAIHVGFNYILTVLIQHRKSTQKTLHQFLFQLFSFACYFEFRFSLKKQKNTHNIKTLIKTIKKVLEFFPKKIKSTHSSVLGC